MELFVLLLLAYMIGSIPFGLILTKAAGLGDVRQIGSGGIGATNVLRTGSKKLAGLTLLLDSLKGAAAIFIVSYLLPHPCAWVDCEGACYCLTQLPFLDTEINYDYLPFIGGVAAIIGHCYPVWLRFKGGKGVATAAGVLLVAVPYVGLICCLTWLCMAFLFKISSLSALITAGIAPVAALFIYGPTPAVLCLLMTLLIFYKHRENIKRLLAGTEPKIGKKT